MTDAIVTSLREDARPHSASGPDRASTAQPPDAVPFRRRFPILPMGFTVALMLVGLVPPARDNPRLGWTLVGVGSALLVWELVLWLAARRSGRHFAVEFLAVKSHYIQACVQFSILLYWGLYWDRVYPELPLIVAQALFVYSLDGVLSWSRGRTWRLGFGPLPIVISTNLLLWFKHDWYWWQFLMLATGVLAKQFVTWNREGKRTHIFNPSAFGQFLFALVLIGTGTTNELTWGREIAATFDPPHMLLVIFLGGLVVQYFFSVTLMTVAAMAALIVANVAYNQATGLYYFVNVNVAGPIFLGIHLLITDPVTSPRSNVGRVIFGAAYGLAYCALFRLFDLWEIPLFWDKLLPVPILNLCVPLIDRFARAGLVGRFNSMWESLLRPKALNLVHMACWILLFAAMWATGYIEAPHPGDSIPFWKRAWAEGRPFAGHSLVMAVGGQAEGGRSAAACNELGLICIEGKIVDENHSTAAKYFAQACELGDESGCVNVALQYLCLGEWRSEEDVQRALDSLERDCAMGGNRRSCFLVGLAYETGRGRPQDSDRAVALYEICGSEDLYACKGLARLALSGTEIPFDVRPVVHSLVEAASAGDPECCWYLGYMYRDGVWLRQDETKARKFLERACALQSEPACAALAQEDLPAYANPVMLMPPWATAFPLEE